MLMIVHAHIFCTTLTQEIWIFLRPVLYLRSYSITILYFFHHYTIRYVLSHKSQVHKELYPNWIKIIFLNHFRKTTITQSLWNNDHMTLALDVSSGYGFDSSLIRERQSTHMFVGRITGSHYVGIFWNYMKRHKKYLWKHIHKNECWSTKNWTVINTFSWSIQHHLLYSGSSIDSNESRTSI